MRTSAHFFVVMSLALGVLAVPVCAQTKAKQSPPAQSKHSKAFTINGKSHTFSFPENYCELGNSQREQSMLDTITQSLKPEIDLMYMAVECADLKALLSGKMQYMNRYLQVQRVTVGGKNTVLRENRETYVQNAAGILPLINHDELDKKLSKGYEELGLSLQGNQFKALGHDGRAAYFGLKIDVLSNTGTPRPLLGLAGATLINQVPITVNVYDGTQKKSSQKEMMGTLQTVINSITAYP